MGDGNGAMRCGEVEVSGGVVDMRRDSQDRPSASGRGAAVQSFIVMEMMKSAQALEREGAQVMHLEVGQPSTGAPRRAVEAAQRALASGAPLGYTVAAGMPELRQRLAKHYGDTHGVNVSSDRIIVTAGSTGAFTLVFLAAFSAGDRVAVTQPGYPCYTNILRALGCEVVPIAVGPHNGFQPSVDDLEAAHRPGEGKPLRGIIVASPANPTGAMLSRERMEGLVNFCDDHGVLYISDEIYAGLSYADTPGGVKRECVSALEVERGGSKAVVINSFSKFFSMTGWRLGWVVLPEGQLCSAVERLAQNMQICAPSLSQVAGIAALDAGDEVEANRARYEVNRARLLDAVASAGLSGGCAPADGAFYVYCDVRRVTKDSVELAGRLLRETGVATTPGVDFDPENGHHFLRLTYCGEYEQVSEAADRLVKFFKREQRRVDTQADTIS